MVKQKVKIILRFTNTITFSCFIFEGKKKSPKKKLWNLNNFFLIKGDVKTILNIEKETKKGIEEKKEKNRANEQIGNKASGSGERMLQFRSRETTESVKKLFHSLRWLRSFEQTLICIRETVPLI